MSRSSSTSPTPPHPPPDGRALVAALEALERSGDPAHLTVLLTQIDAAAPTWLQNADADQLVDLAWDLRASAHHLAHFADIRPLQAQLKLVAVRIATDRR